MTQAFILQEHHDEHDQIDNSLHQWMVWVQSPLGAWLLLQGGWPSAHTARRFIERCGYTLIDTDTGLSQLDRQLEERQRAARPILHLRSVH